MLHEIVLAATGSTAPWRATPVAGMVGALVGVGGATFAKNRELARHDQARWDEEILDLSVVLIAKCRDLAESTTRVASDGEPDPEERRSSLFVEFIREVQPLAQRLGLISSSRLNNALNAMIPAAHTAPERVRPDDLQPEKEQMLKKYLPTLPEATEAFYNAVRCGDGSTSSRLPSRPLAPS